MKEGIQLLSPSLQRGLAYDNQQEVIPKRRPPPPPPPSSSFHFDRFTTESCQKRYIPPPPPSSDDSSPASPLYYPSQRTSYRHPSLHHSRSIDGATAPSSLTSSFMSYYKPPPSFHTRASLVSNTTTSAPIQVVMSGWFQRRRGKLIKRWKNTFLVLKADHQLCFYSNENTINGKLEERFEVLRITYQSSSSHVFQVIGIGREQTPFKEELRIIETGCLKAWIIAFRRYFDHASMEVAIEEMPELLLLPQVGEDEEEEEDEDEEEDYDFAAAVEEMVLRPFPFNEEENQEESIKMYQRQTITFDFKTECPIIERTSQVPMLERSGSESMISNSNSNWKLNQ